MGVMMSCVANTMITTDDEFNLKFDLHCSKAMEA